MQDGNGKGEDRADGHLALSVDTLLSSAWHFSHASGLVACEALRLLADGTIGGYEHPNERGWKLVSDQLAFTDDAGQVSTLFDRVELLADGSLQLSGAFLLDEDVRPTLLLRQVADTFERDLPNLTRSLFEGLIDQGGWEIGDHTYGQPAVIIMQPWKLVIGRYCSIASGVWFIASYHRTETVSTYPFLVHQQNWRYIPPDKRDHTTRGDIVIGNDVWLATSVFVGSGVTIGDGAVIGASSVVTRDVPPYAVVVGNPARVVRYRFEPAVIERLLRLRWWDWPDAKVEAFLPLMLSDDIERFLDAADGCARLLYQAEADEAADVEDGMAQAEELREDAPVVEQREREADGTSAAAAAVLVEPPGRAGFWSRFRQSRKPY